MYTVGASYVASHCGSLGLANRLHQGIWFLILNIYIGKIFPLLRIFLFLPNLAFAHTQLQVWVSFQSMFGFMSFKMLLHESTGEKGKYPKRQGDHLFSWGFTAWNKQNPPNANNKKTSKIMSVGTSPEHLSQIPQSLFSLPHILYYWGVVWFVITDTPT